MTLHAPRVVISEVDNTANCERRSLDPLEHRGHLGELLLEVAVRALLRKEDNRNKVRYHNFIDFKVLAD